MFPFFRLDFSPPPAHVPPATSKRLTRASRPVRALRAEAELSYEALQRAALGVAAALQRRPELRASAPAAPGVLGSALRRGNAARLGAWGLGLAPGVGGRHEYQLFAGYMGLGVLGGSWRLGGSQPSL